MNIDSIGTHKYPISQLLDPESKHVYEVPKYQREYVWYIKEWEAFFDDLYENENGYYLGSIICIHSQDDPVNSSRFEVVDGQQRLTTISLFLAALYKALEEKKDQLDDEQESDRIKLKQKLVLRRTEADLRVIPQAQGSNLADYQWLFTHEKIISRSYPWPPYAMRRRIYGAYAYFTRRITSLMEESSNPVGVIFDLLDKINSAILVMITVTSHADAYKLFEALNHRGTPLTAVDLIKNLLLSRLDASGEDLDYYFGRWKDILNALGDNYATQERFFRQNYNAFRKEINEPFLKGDKLYPLGTIATRSNLFEIYEQIVKKDPKEFINELSINAQLYALILHRNVENIPEPLAESFLDLQRVEGVPSYLLLLYLLRKKDFLEIGYPDIIQMNNILISFFVRRNLTDVPPTRDLTRLFMDFISRIEQNGFTGDEIKKQLQKILIECSADDDAFEKALRGPIYEINFGVTRYILCSIAKDGMTAETQKNLWALTPSKQFVWTIEHIFPQGDNIPQCWVDMIADGDRTKAIEYQSEYVHTLGNLTITGYNSTLSNKSFEEKKDRKDNNGNYIGYKNGINLNADVVDKDKWTIDAIRARTDILVQQVMQKYRL